MFDLHDGAQPDERFHLQTGRPLIKAHFDVWLLRRTSWACLTNPDGSEGRFVSWWLVGHLQWYHGTVKCDGTRTRMAWSGQLGEPRTMEQRDYVMTTTPAELWAFRWRLNGPGEPVWDNMGGS